MQDGLKEKYIFYEELGSGGSGTVCRAYDRHLRCYMAVKEYEAADGLPDHELEMLRELRHPALPSITDYLEEDGKRYLVMEYIEGKNLAEYLEEHGSVKQEQAVRWAAELADVLVYLHERECPVIYRDMKPANIMIDKTGRLRLVDFGTACLRYQENTAYDGAGTRGYGAPEQFGIRGRKEVDERSDIYGLGATLFHMLTGASPAAPPGLMQPLRFYNGALSAELEKIVKKATEEEKEKRYRTMRQFRQALERYRSADRVWNRMKRGAGILYGTVLFAAGACFFRMYAAAERALYSADRSGAEADALKCAGVILLLCLGRAVARRGMERGGGNRLRQEKSILLTAKKGRGLPLILLTGVILLLLAGGDVSAKEENGLRVDVRNENGQKILVRFDAVYPLEDTLRLELPPGNFREGERYELRLECVNSDTGEKSSRTFYLKYLKGLEPQQ